MAPPGSFPPSVINYYVVEKIHRLAEKTECWNIWKQLEKEVQSRETYNSVQNKFTSPMGNPKSENSNLHSILIQGKWILVLIFILLKTETLASLAASHIWEVIKLTSS